MTKQRIVIFIFLIGTLLCANWLKAVAIVEGDKPTSPQTAVPNSPIIPGTVRIDATFEHIGVRWNVSGDTNLNSTMTLEFREAGTAVWQPGAVAMRAHPSLIVNGDPLNLNYWAASALFLTPDTTYEIRLTLTDPDGGGSVQTVTATTRAWPVPSPNGRTLYVIPGSGGGSGTIGDPFQGLQAAADAAQPGDTFHVAAGTYIPFQLLIGGSPGQPIAFVGPEDGTAVIDGNNTDRGVVTLGEYDQTLGHVILTNLVIQNGAWGIDAQHTHDLFIHHNTIQDVDFGIYNRRADGVEFNQTVCDNFIHGRTPWPQTGGQIPGERGIDLRGTGNVICFNEIRNFGDCISVQPFTSDSYGNDIFGNDAALCVDDGIEIDYNQSNVRVWRNRVMNARMGASVQPIAGGPAYIFRNEFFNLESQPLKMNNQPSGFVVAHNTAVKLGNGLGDPSVPWRNAIFRNNLFLGTAYAFEFTTIASDGFRDFDYDAWGTTRDPSLPFFKWDDVRYDRITDLPPGVEDNGVAAAFSDLVNATLPPVWNTEVPPGSRDLRLVNGVDEVDAGVPLANLNDPFVINVNPDMGAFELGQSLPHYGPRVQTPDFSQSSKAAHLSTPMQGEIVTYTITLRNTGVSLNETARLTDTLPAELSYVPGSLAASLGTVDDGNVPMLLWSGIPGDVADVTITYAATVSAAEAMPVTNTAVIQTSDTTFTRSATIIINGTAVYLPLMRR